MCKKKCAMITRCEKTLVGWKRSTITELGKQLFSFTNEDTTCLGYLNKHPGSCHKWHKNYKKAYPQ